MQRLPFTVKILLENVLRRLDGYVFTEDDVRLLAEWTPQPAVVKEFPFLPSRVILQDFTGVPTVVDLAAMRSAVAQLGGDAQRVNPLVPADLIIDHSVQVDWFGSTFSFATNVKKEYERNGERYALPGGRRERFRTFGSFPRYGHCSPGEPRVSGERRPHAPGERSERGISRHPRRD